jgi:hypothetical protein
MTAAAPIAYAVEEVSIEKLRNLIETIKVLIRS